MIFCKNKNEFLHFNVDCLIFVHKLILIEHLSSKYKKNISFLIAFNSLNYSQMHGSIIIKVKRKKKNKTHKMNICENEVSFCFRKFRNLIVHASYLSHPLVLCTSDIVAESLLLRKDITMTEAVDIPLHDNHGEGEGLDNPLRAIVVVNLPEAPEGEMEERMLDAIQAFDEVEAFFDQFDEAVAIPNEKHIKYEVGSDGLVIFVVDSLEMQATVLKYIDDFSRQVDEDVSGNGIKDGNNEADEEDRHAKKKSKTS